MKEEFITYKIRHGDTLSSLSSRLSINPDELKEFHNTHCGKMDKIWFDALLGVEYIVIPVNFKNEKQKAKEKSEELPPKFFQKDFFDPQYSVIEKFEKPLENDLEITYSVLLKVQDSKDKNFIAGIDRKNFKKNGETPDDKISSLSLACFDAISPVTVNLDSEGKLTGLYEYKKLVRKFTDKRADIEDFHTGEISKEYIDKFQDIISDEALFFTQLKSSLFYQALFPNREWFHKKSSWKEDFYFVQHSFPVKCKMEIEHHHEDLDVALTIITGKNIENRSLQELLRGTRYQEESDDPFLGEIILKYTTHKKNKHLVQMEASAMLCHEDGELFQKQHLILNTIVL